MWLCSADSHTPLQQQEQQQYQDHHMAGWWWYKCIKYAQTRLVGVRQGRFYQQRLVQDSADGLIR